MNKKNRLFLLLSPFTLYSLLFFLGPMLILFIFALAFIGIVVLLIFSFPDKFGYILLRIKTFIDPKSGDDFQSQNALDAIKQGGFTGLGFGEWIF